MVTIKQRLKLNQNTMRKTVILLMTLTLVVTSIGAATAKGKPDKSDKSDEPVYYDVTMDLVGDSDGLSTDNCGADPLFMRLEESRSGSLLATADGAFPSDEETSEPDLHLKADFAELSFDGCWHGTSPDSDVSGPDFFRMVFDRDGDLEKITWHFDVKAEMSESKNGKWENMRVLHKYALTSQSATWNQSVTGNEAAGIVTGSFELWDYTNKDGLLWKLIGTPDLEFTLTITGPYRPRG